MSKDKKLNNLLGIEDYTEKDFIKKSKTTKRTDVAKDIFEKAEVTGKDVFSEDKINSKQEIVFKSLNNLYSLDQYTEKTAKKTNRTDVAKDVLQEGCGCEKGTKKEKKEKKEKKGLTAGQKKLPEALQKAILKKQGR